MNGWVGEVGVEGVWRLQPLPWHTPSPLHHPPKMREKSDVGGERGLSGGTAPVARARPLACPTHPSLLPPAVSRIQTSQSLTSLPLHDGWCDGGREGSGWSQGTRLPPAPSLATRAGASRTPSPPIMRERDRSVKAWRGSPWARLGRYSRYTLHPPPYTRSEARVAQRSAADRRG